MATGILPNDNDILAAGFKFAGLGSLSSFSQKLFRSSPEHCIYLQVWSAGKQFKYLMMELRFPWDGRTLDRGELKDAEDLNALVELATEIAP